MGRLAGYRGREYARVAESLGWAYQRTHGDHMIYTKPGERLNLSIPDRREVAEGTARTLVRAMHLSVEQFIALARK